MSIYATISKKVGTDPDTDSIKVPPLSQVDDLIDVALGEKNVIAFCHLLAIKRFGGATNEEEALCLTKIESVWPLIIKKFL